MLLKHCYWVQLVSNHLYLRYNLKEVLKKGCPLNIDDFKQDRCAGSTFHGISIVIDFLNTDPDTFNLITLRSFGESFYHHITDAALEFGYLAT